MKTENKILMDRARKALAGKWETSVITYLIYMLILNAGGAVSLIVGGPMELGASIFSLNLSRNKKVDYVQILDGFKRFGESLIAYLLIVVYTLLWSLLFIIPGIIAAFSYAQTFFVMADDKKIKGADAIKKSQEMMRGYKWKLFCLMFRFTGWFILSMLTCGIGFLWLVPYMRVSFANFYEDIK